MNIQLWVLAFLGIWLSFGIKFLARSDKNKEKSLRYWWKDNWFEFTLSLTVLIILMIVATNPETGYDQEKFNLFLKEKLPSFTWITFPVKIVIPAFIGYGANEVVYFLVKRKLKTAHK